MYKTSCGHLFNEDSAFTVFKSPPECPVVCAGKHCMALAPPAAPAMHVPVRATLLLSVNGTWRCRKCHSAAWWRASVLWQARSRSLRSSAEEKRSWK